MDSNYSIYNGDCLAWFKEYKENNIDLTFLDPPFNQNKEYRYFNDNLSVKLRFRIMTEIKAEGNILNSKTYPEILDNTLNFILPLHDSIEESNIFKKMKFVFTQNELKQFKIFKIKHLRGGYFLVFQTSLSKNQSKQIISKLNLLALLPHSSYQKVRWVIKT